MSHRQILLVIYGLMAGMFLSSLDQTVVGTAIRTIGDDLHGLDQQAWVTTAYLIVSTISVPIYGKLSDVFGRRPLFIFGIGAFLAGSLLASFSTSMLMLAGFRAVQGLGAAHSCRSRSRSWPTSWPRVSVPSTRATSSLSSASPRSSGP
jgi:Arabinose efflux permease